MSNESLLTLKSADRTDAGEYACKLTNSEGIAVTMCQLDVEASSKLGFATFVKSQNLDEGEPLVLQCSAKPNANALDLIWFRNGKEIPLNPDFICTRQGDVFTLRVNEIYPEDSGLFGGKLVCEATDETCVCSCSVFVQG